MSEALTPEPGKIVEVLDLPSCDFCAQAGIEEPGIYDFATRYGPWANGCERHYLEHRAAKELGVGLGQRLILRVE